MIHDSTVQLPGHSAAACRSSEGFVAKQSRTSKQNASHCGQRILGGKHQVVACGGHKRLMMFIDFWVYGSIIVWVWPTQIAQEAVRADFPKKSG